MSLGGDTIVGSDGEEFHTFIYTLQGVHPYLKKKIVAGTDFKLYRQGKLEQTNSEQARTDLRCISDVIEQNANFVIPQLHDLSLYLNIFSTLEVVKRNATLH